MRIGFHSLGLNYKEKRNREGKTKARAQTQDLDALNTVRATAVPLRERRTSSRVKDKERRQRDRANSTERKDTHH